MKSLTVFMNMGGVAHLPPHSCWYGLAGPALYEAIKTAGFEGVQDGDPELAKQAGLQVADSGRVDQPEEAIRRAQQGQSIGAVATTLHVGSGMEDDAQADELTSAVIEAVKTTGHPMMIETHRATITQDMWRCVKLIERNPELRINGDFSHFYTGQEMVYGDFDAKLDFMDPIFTRVRFMHGRIGSPGNMQVDIGDGHSPVPQQTGGADFLAHFKSMWTRSMLGFLQSEGEGDTLVFAPEILGATIYYARCFPQPDGSLREESDRVQQALVYADIARECWSTAKKSLSL